MYVHFTYLIFQKIPAVIKTRLHAPKYRIWWKAICCFRSYGFFEWFFTPLPPPKKKKKRKKERMIYHDNVMSYGAGYLSHNFCSIVRARLAILLPNDFVAIDYCKITVDLNLPEFPCIISRQSVTGNLHQMHLTVLAAKRWDLQ